MIALHTLKDGVGDTMSIKKLAPVWTLNHFCNSGFASLLSFYTCALLVSV